MSASISSSTARNKLSNSERVLRGTQQPIDITKDELSRIGDALKNAEFRKLFLDYCEEIQDPVNRQRYEDEIKQFEAERGVEVRFIKPDPGFVIKTSVDGAKKCFVNIAKSVEVGKPTSEATCDDKTGARGLNWAIPMAQAGPRDDLDAHGKLCRVFDVVFHPDALYLSQRDAAFRKCLVDTALDAVEREFKVKLDRTNLKFPKLQFKGVARPTVIRRLAKDAPAETSEPHPLESIYPPMPTAQSAEPKLLPLQTPTSEYPKFTVPKYVIKHRHGIDLSEFTEELDAKLNVTIPRELVVEVELPLLKSSSECQLDVTAKTVYLLSEKPGARYRLKLDLPYAVNDKNGTARFEAEKRRLCITLPVLQHSSEQQRAMHETLIHLNREDSGVESDVRDELNSNSGEDVVSDGGVVDEKKRVEEGVEIKNEDEPDNSNANRDTISCTTPTKVIPAAFLKNSLLYHFPSKFDCNVLDNVMSLVLHVRNVQPESISSIHTEKTIHIQFTSIGAGYYPTYYAFFLQLPKETDFKIESFSAEAWENNLVLNLNMAATIENLDSYLAGLDSNDIKHYAVQEKFQVLHGSRQRKKSPSAFTSKKAPVPSLDVSVGRSECEKTIEIAIKPKLADHQMSSSACTTNEDEELQQQRKKTSKKQKRKNKKRRSLSETAYDDIKAYHKTQAEMGKNQPNESGDIVTTKEVPVNETTTDLGYTNGEKVSTSMAVPLISQQRVKQRSYSESRDSVASSSNGTASFKGILKHYSRYDPRPSISGSSSSIDDCCSYSCSTDAAVTGSLRFSQSFSDIPEENSNATLSESCKKTVRFNEVIKKQVFRLDSSILGQRKKNQKRRNQKQRAFQRRLSEGDSADYEEMKRGSSNGNELNYFNPSSNSNGKKSNDNKKIPIKKQSPRPRLESESSSDIDNNKNSMMFEMDM